MCHSVQKNQNRTHTHDTCFGNTVGLPIPILKPTVRQLSHIPRAWVKIVYIKPFSVGVGRDTITMDSGFGMVTLIQKEMMVVTII